MKKRIRKKRKKSVYKRKHIKRCKNGNSNTSKNRQTKKNSNIDNKSPIEQTKNKNILEYVKLCISIVIAIIGFILTNRSNEIYKSQKEIQEKQISPAIDISVILKDESNEYMNEVIDKFTINNVGGIANYIDCSVRPFFLVDYYELESGEELISDRVIVPIKSYTVPMITNEKIGFRSGEIARIYANRNLLDIVDNMKQWQNFEVDPNLLNNKKIFQISIGYFLEIDCQDLFKKEWTEYYSCFPGYDTIYEGLPGEYDTEFGVTKIEEDDDNNIIDIVESCFGGGTIMETDFIYENGKSIENNYRQFLNAFLENYDKEFFYDTMQSGEYDLLEDKDGHLEVKHVK